MNWLAWLISFIIVCGVYGGSYAIGRYYNPGDKDLWCAHNMPQLNISNPKVSYCFGEGWDKYCKISYPEYCPKNNFTDKDRCLRNCATYKTKECLC